jgi:hypothetical protein
MGMDTYPCVDNIVSFRQLYTSLGGLYINPGTDDPKDPPVREASDQFVSILIKSFIVQMGMGIK